MAQMPRKVTVHLDIDEAQEQLARLEAQVDRIVGKLRGLRIDVVAARRESERMVPTDTSALR